MKNKNIKKCAYRVAGMHCASCELLIEKRLLKESGVKVVDASKLSEEVRIEYDGEKPDLKKINKMFKKNNYEFFRKGSKNKKKTRNWKKDVLVAIISIALIGGFLAMNRYGVVTLSGVKSGSSLFGFLLFGLMAGISSCAALVGGIVLSMSKQWKSEKKPHILFNVGRLLSYALVGFLLGIVGKKAGISLTVSSILTFSVAGLMLILGLQMVGLKIAQKVTIAMPKSVTRFIANDDLSGKTKWMPALIGALTVLLPCGFTITTESLAITSGDPIKGMLMMLSFALGTLPMLLIIGFSSMKILKKPHWSGIFSSVAGIIVIFLALYNINAQIIVLNWGGISIQAKGEARNIVPMKNGKQIIKMDALAYGYEPNYIRVREGIPVVWEIEDKGTSGCTNAIVSRGLFEGEIKLTPGQTSVKEFTPKKAGLYKFSCWMGMVSGTIEVVGKGMETNGDVPVESGASGCGNGSLGSCGGGCGVSSCACGGAR